MDKYYESLRQFRRELTGLMRQIKFTVLDEKIIHEQVIPVATYAPWANDVDFLEIYKCVKENTLVDIYRCYELYTLTKNLNDKEGEIIEIGVWKGGTSGLIAKTASVNKLSKVLLFDTFEGVPKAGLKDTLYKGGEHSDTTQEIVIDLMKKLEVDNYKIYKGIFPDDFPDLKLDKIKLAHIDVDVYQSAFDVLNYIWKWIIPGGVVVFDDCGFWGCEGITKLFNEIDYKNAFKVYNLNGHGLIIKL